MMKSFRLQQVLTAGTLALLAAVSASAQGVVQDWSHRNVIFSNPGAYADAVRNGTVDKWQTITSDPRYQQQLLRRNLVRTGAPLNAHGANPNANAKADKNPGSSAPAAIVRDWNVAMDQTGQFLTGGSWKSSSTGTTYFDCIQDSASTTSAAAVRANFKAGQLINIQSSGNATNGSTFEVARLLLDAGSTTGNASPACSTANYAEVKVLRGLNGTIANSSQNGGIISHNVRYYNDGEIFPAKYNFSTTTVDCVTDYVAYHTFDPGASNRASLMAFNNLYTGCGGQTPSVYWAYDTGSQIVISPVLSLDGTQIAFIQGSAATATTLTAGITAAAASMNVASTIGFSVNDSVKIDSELILITAITAGTPGSFTVTRAQGGTTAATHALNAAVTSVSSAKSDLVILKWKASDGSGSPANSAMGSTPQAPNVQASAAAMVSCRTGSITAGGCMYKIPLNARNGRSAPFTDYTNDIIWVGDDAGVLHKIAGAFKGTPAETTVTMSAGNILSSPVFDPISGNVFVTTAVGTLVRVPVTTTGASLGTPVTSTAFGLAIQTSTQNNYLLDPILDAQAGRVYVTDPAAAGSSTSNPSFNYFAVGFAAAAAPAFSVALTTTTATAFPHPKLFSGQFDNTYYSAGTGLTGAFYICGGDNTGLLNLYRIPLGTISGFGTKTALSLQSAVNTTSGANCSPTSEFFDSTSLSTTLSAAITVTTSPLTFSVGSTTGFAVKDIIKIDNELMTVTATSATSFTVTRASGGTTAATHLISAAVTKPARDLTFVSVTSNGNKTGCTGPCLYTFDITSNALPANALAGISSTSGTTGIVIDSKANASGIAGSAQIYYSPLTDGIIVDPTGASQTTGNCTGVSSKGNVLGACAVQASQAALQ